VSALSELITGLGCALDQLAKARQHLRQASASRDQAADNLAETLRGAAHPDAERASAELANSRQQTESALAATDKAEQRLRAYLRHIEGEWATPSADDRIDTARASLGRGPDGSQTTGWWLRHDGSRTRLRSGSDADPNGWQQKSKRHLQHTFPQANPALHELSRHVEIQLAIRSHEQPFDHEILVIDRRVCGRDSRSRQHKYSCDKYLPAVSAEGATLTVVEHDGTQVTYVGRRAR
jgi:hypothetical protein